MRTWKKSGENLSVLVLIPPSPHNTNVIRDVLYGSWCGGKLVGGGMMPPLSSLYVATVLAADKNSTTLIDCSADQHDLKSLLDLAPRFNILVLQTSSITIDDDAEIARELRSRNPDLVTIFYGSHPTFMPESTLDKDGVDLIARREPEFIIRDLVRALKAGGEAWKKVKGIGYRDNGQVILNEGYGFIEDLDELPVPDRSLLPRGQKYFNPLVRHYPYTSALSSRGCYSRCRFCTAPYFMGGKIRARSAESVISELEALKRQGYREIYFRDETFTAFPSRNQQICRHLIDRRLDLNWICNSIPGELDREAMAEMKRAGCHTLKFGVESGAPEILEKSNKRISLDAVRDEFRWARELGLSRHAHIMFGMPGETRESIEATIEFLLEIDPDSVSFQICSPYPGTPLYQELVDTYPEIIGDGSQVLRSSELHSRGILNHLYTNLSNEVLEDSIRRANRRFYFRPRYLLKSLSQVRSFSDLRRLWIAGSQLLEFSFLGSR